MLVVFREGWHCDEPRKRDKEWEHVYGKGEVGQ